MNKFIMSVALSVVACGSSSPSPGNGSAEELMTMHLFEGTPDDVFVSSPSSDDDPLGELFFELRDRGRIHSLAVKSCVNGTASCRVVLRAYVEERLEGGLLLGLKADFKRLPQAVRAEQGDQADDWCQMAVEPDGDGNPEVTQKTAACDELAESDPGPSGQRLQSSFEEWVMNRPHQVETSWLCSKAIYAYFLCLIPKLCPAVVLWSMVAGHASDCIYVGLDYFTILFVVDRECPAESTQNWVECGRFDPEGEGVNPDNEYRLFEFSDDYSRGTALQGLSIYSSIPSKEEGSFKVIRCEERGRLEVGEEVEILEMLNLYSYIQWCRIEVIPDCTDTCLDTCPDATVVECDKMYDGDTSRGRTEWSQYTACYSGSDMSGPEQVFAFCAERDGQLEVSAVTTRDSDFRPHLFLLKDDCRAETCFGSHDLTLYHSVDEGHCYYIVADSPEGVSGEFHLLVECPGAMSDGW